MGTSKHFEDLQIWQEARRIVGEVYKYTAELKDYGFNDQIQRAAISIMNNIAEGYESGSDPVFKRYLFIAKGSCGEVRSMLYLAQDLNYISTVEGELLIRDCKGLAIAINKLADYLTKDK